MKLSLKLLHAELAVHYPDVAYIQTGKSVPQLSSSSSVTTSLDPMDDVVYIHIPDLFQDEYLQSASVITKEPFAELFPNCSLIVLPEDTDMLEIPAFIASVFSRYFSWSDSLYDAIARSNDLQTLIDLTVPMLEQPMYFADAGWKMLAYWGGDMVYVNPTWSYQMKFSYLPYHVYQGIIDADDMGTYRDTDEVVLCVSRPGFGDIPFISKAIRKEGKHYGNFFIIGLYHKLDARDFEIAEHLGNIVATALYGDSNYLETSSLYSSHFIIDVIEGNLSSTSLMVDQLHALNWSYESDYALALISLQEEDAAIANHVMMMVNGVGNDVNSFTYQGNIVAIFNRYSHQADRIRSRLGGLARDFNTVVALSNQFSKFSDIRSAYLQASFLLEHAAKTGLSGSLLKFTDYYLDYLTQCTEVTAASHSPVSRLHDHDIAHGSEYCTTLYHWLLLERNTVKTAEVLYIHRNTLKNRLTNIENILKLDLDNPLIRMQMLVGLHGICGQKTAPRLQSGPTPQVERG